ncbi:hypothetical protein Xbed_03773 [Xenorhabdus beddingii]|uniref:Uncharacterized protein n=1 Tax=Xenorhabdus beddingii TaxID=40578 RepID=A0A1Y2S7Y2_9GAMM|nr:hypothetical protein Xbed_03773 [Xenorhabdus beddingii]
MLTDVAAQRAVEFGIMVKQAQELFQVFRGKQHHRRAGQAGQQRPAGMVLQQGRVIGGGRRDIVHTEMGGRAFLHHGDCALPQPHRPFMVAEKMAGDGQRR